MGMLLEAGPKVSSRWSGEKRRRRGGGGEKSRGGFQIYSKLEIGGSPGGDASSRVQKCGDFGVPERSGINYCRFTEGSSIP